MEATNDFAMRTERVGELLRETYHIGVRFNRTVPRHVHETYQLEWSPDTLCQHWYRGSAQISPPQSISMVHPGETHSSPLMRDRDRSVRFHVLYLPPDFLAQSGTSRFLPYHLADERIRSLLSALFNSEVFISPSLAQDQALLALQTVLLENASDGIVVRNQVQKAGDSFRTVGPVARALEYLHAHVCDSVSLADLAQVAGVDPSYLCRAFGQGVGIPPHRYQNQLRLEWAKKELLRGATIAQVAFAAGFAHQSHFGQHFKRLVGISPQAYVASFVRH